MNLFSPEFHFTIFYFVYFYFYFIFLFFWGGVFFCLLFMSKFNMLRAGPPDMVGSLLIRSEYIFQAVCTLPTVKNSVQFSPLTYWVVRET